MRFNLVVDCNNAAFGDEPCAELKRILDEVAAKVENWRGYDETDPTLNAQIPVRDINGNTVGLAYFSDNF